MKRSAQQILEDGFYASCTDYGRVFCHLAKEQGIKTKFMHYLEMNQFRNDPEHLSLHVFCECYLGEHTVFLDPQKGLIQYIVDKHDYRHLLKRNGKEYVLGYEETTIGEKGIDSEEKLLALMTEVGKGFLV